MRRDGGPGASRRWDSIVRENYRGFRLLAQSALDYDGGYAVGLGFEAQQVGAGGKGLDVEGEGFAFGDVGLTAEDASTGDVVEGNRGVGGREVATDVDGAVGRVGIYAEAALYGDGVDAKGLADFNGEDVGGRGARGVGGCDGDVALAFGHAVDDHILARYEELGDAVVAPGDGIGEVIAVGVGEKRGEVDGGGRCAQEHHERCLLYGLWSTVGVLDNVAYGMGRGGAVTVGGGEGHPVAAGVAVVGTQLDTELNGGGAGYGHVGAVNGGGAGVGRSGDDGGVLAVVVEDYGEVVGFGLADGELDGGNGAFGGIYHSRLGGDFRSAVLIENHGDIDHGLAGVVALENKHGLVALLHGSGIGIVGEAYRGCLAYFHLTGGGGSLVEIEPELAGLGLYAADEETEIAVLAVPVGAEVVPACGIIVVHIAAFDEVAFLDGGEQWRLDALGAAQNHAEVGAFGDEERTVERNQDQLAGGATTLNHIRTVAENGLTYGRGSRYDVDFDIVFAGALGIVEGGVDMTDVDAAFGRDELHGGLEVVERVEGSDGVVCTYGRIVKNLIVGELTLIGSVVDILRSFGGEGTDGRAELLGGSHGRSLGHCCQHGGDAATTLFDFLTLAGGIDIERVVEAVFTVVGEAEDFSAYGAGHGAFDMHLLTVEHGDGSGRDGNLHGDGLLGEIVETRNGEGDGNLILTRGIGRIGYGHGKLHGLAAHGDGGHHAGHILLPCLVAGGFACHPVEFVGVIP